MSSTVLKCDCLKIPVQLGVSARVKWTSLSNSANREQHGGPTVRSSFLKCSAITNEWDCHQLKLYSFLFVSFICYRYIQIFITFRKYSSLRVLWRVILRLNFVRTKKLKLIYQSTLLLKQNLDPTAKYFFHFNKEISSCLSY